MENTSGRQKDESRKDAQNDVDNDMLEESDDAIPVSDEAQGNRGAEKIEERGRKKQQTQDEAKSITGSEPHKDITNDHAGEGPAPLDRY